jgi:hypothetical protein
VDGWEDLVMLLIDMFFDWSLSQSNISNFQHKHHHKEIRHP